MYLNYFLSRACQVLHVLPSRFTDTSSVDILEDNPGPKDPFLTAMTM